MGNKVEELLREADDFIKNNRSRNCSAEVTEDLIRGLSAIVREYHPIVNPPVPVVENPNVVAWRPMVKEGLEKAVAELKKLLGHDNVIATTHIRRSVMKDGGVKAKLGIKFEAKSVYRRDIDPVKVIQRNVNAIMAANGLPKSAVLTTSGSQMNFSARVYLEGDEDYSMWVRMSRL